MPPELRKSRKAGVKVIEEERVPDTTDVQKSMESIIELDRAKVIFATSFGYYDPHVLVMAKKHPEVTFLHFGGLYDESSTRRTSAPTLDSSMNAST